MPEAGPQLSSTSRVQCLGFPQVGLISLPYSTGSASPWPQDLLGIHFGHIKTKPSLVYFQNVHMLLPCLIDFLQGIEPYKLPVLRIRVLSSPITHFPWSVNLIPSSTWSRRNLPFLSQPLSYFPGFICNDLSPTCSSFLTHYNIFNLLYSAQYIKMKWPATSEPVYRC